MMTESRCVPSNAFRSRPMTRQLVKYMPSPRNRDYSSIPDALQIDSQEPKERQTNNNDYLFGRRQYNNYLKDYLWTHKNLCKPMPEIKMSALPSRTPFTKNAKIAGRLFSKSSASHGQTLRKLPTEDHDSFERCLSVQIPRNEITYQDLNRPTTTTSITYPFDEDRHMYSFGLREPSCYKLVHPQSDTPSEYYFSNRLPFRPKKPNIRSSRSVNMSMFMKGNSKMIHDRQEYDAWMG